MSTLSENKYEKARNESDANIRACFNSAEGRKQAKEVLGLSDSSITKWLAPDRYPDAPKVNIDEITCILAGLGLKAVHADSEYYDAQTQTVICDQTALDGARAIKFKGCMMEVMAEHHNDKDRLLDEFIRLVRGC